MKKLALTYDDGPNTFTLGLLNVLAKHDVQATFFMVGKFVKERPDIVQQVAKAGHLIANHTMTHPQLPKLTLSEVEQEIGNCEVALTEAVGKHSKLFRPPFVLTNAAIERIVESLGLTTVMWKAAASDWKNMGVDWMANKIHAELDGGSGIVLMHDGDYLQMGANRADTVALTDRMIGRYKNDGYEFTSPLEVTSDVIY
jgi:peptidoglycan/xylan/chitin deacetylase (PgdA/CDA1 family)